MSPLQVSHEDWLVLAHENGELRAELVVHRRVVSEQAAEIAMLRQQLVACADEVHTPPGEEG